MLSRFWTELAPSLFIFTGQLLLLFLIPNQKVQFKSAFLGAAAGTLLWEVLKRVFAAWVKHSIRLSVIYGSLIALPMLLIWLMLVWMILLLMAELTYVHQNFRILNPGHPRPSSPDSSRSKI